MNFLVTGARGFVGRGLLDVLAASGHCGVGTSRAAWAAPHPPPPVGWHGATRADVLMGLHDAADTDAIVHLEVKQHTPRPTPDDIDEFDRVNVGGTREWLDWAARHGVQRFVFVSSIKAVAPGTGSQFEHALLNPDTPYGRSKAVAEKAVRAWANEDPRRMAVILRPAPVYGPGNEANLAAFVRQILAGKPCLVGQGLTQKSIVSRGNLAAAIALTATHPAAGCEVFNVSDRETLSLGQLAALIAELGHAPKPKRIPTWLAHWIAPLGDMIGLIARRDFPLTTARLKAIDETSVFPCDKLVAAGFRHPQTTREGLEEMLAWLHGEGAAGD